MKPETVTRTEVEAVEKEYVLCPLCEMDHEPDDMVHIRANPKVRLSKANHELCWIDDDEDRETIFENLSVTAEDETSLCPACAESIGLEEGVARGRDFVDIGESASFSLLPSHPEDFLPIAILALWGLLMVIMIIAGMQ